MLHSGTMEDVELKFKWVLESCSEVVQCIFEMECLLQCVMEGSDLAGQTLQVQS